MTLLIKAFAIFFRVVFSILVLLQIPNDTRISSILLQILTDGDRDEQGSSLRSICLHSFWWTATDDWTWLLMRKLLISSIVSHELDK